MRQGMCMALLLLAGCINSALAIEVTEQEVQQAAVSSQVVNRVAALTRLYNNSDFRALEFNLSQLAPLQQEAVRAQLVQHAGEFGQLDQMKADWLQAQADRKPAFTVVEQGDGYLVTQSAFHYGAQSRGLVLHWQQILLAQKMVQQAEAGSLILSKWLTGDIHTQKQRRNIFLEQLPILSSDAVAKLVAQFSSDSLLMWLPDNAIIASLAALSGDQPLYHLLWRRRTDQYSLAELNRLADLAPSPQAVEQLMAATINPSLKQQAYRALAVQKPMSPQTREFLVDKLNEVDDGHVVATQLAQQGYASWLKQIAASSRNQVLQKNLRLALTELP
ncbi:hypothetical protein L4D76_08810 [Photobacterium sagamiensis]|uniref:hypothetical protein n=1 Tax=Photobacterium sagamiensis TaxID=2910241 RepID=UPI003D122000